MPAAPETPRIRLTPFTGTEDPAGFAALLAPGYSGNEEVPRALFEQTRTFLAAHPRPDPWGSYLVYAGDTAVGVCAYKSAPDAAGGVEIAYSTAPAYEGRGYAKAMIAALYDLASRNRASLVLAHTLPEENPSNRALRRQGFTFAGEVMDPEDGRVWRWEKPAAPP